MIIAIPDTHFPWVNEQALEVILDDVYGLQPEMVVQMGDLYDFYSFSSHHPTSRNLTTPSLELTNARGSAETFWAAIRAASPETRCYQLLGNHDLRIRKNIREKAPELEAVLDTMGFDSLWKFDGVTTVFDYREPLELDGTVFHHGWLKHGDHMRRFLKPTVIGHLHTGRVEMLNLWGQPIWELCTGFLGDPEAMVFSYTALQARKWENWTTGYGLIDERGPRFISINA